MRDAETAGGPPVCSECQDASIAAADVDGHLSPPPDEISRAHFSSPTKLAPWNYYLICDHHNIVARWQNDSHGWMLYRGDGFSRARHVADEVPIFGEFVLIDIGIDKHGETTRLSHVTAYQLQPEFALLELVKSDIAVLRTITGPATLNEKQKDLVRDFVKSHFLRHVWAVLDELLERT